jgi:hypothetical protein
VDAAVWGLLGTLVGALASMGTTWLAGRSSQALQQESAREERAERANSFQRQTLLELQEAIHDALRLIHRAHIEDRQARQSDQVWGRNVLSEEVDEGIRLAQRRVSILVERLESDDLRLQVKSLMSAATRVLLASNQNEANHLLIETTSIATNALEAIGSVLRRHY